MAFSHTWPELKAELREKREALFERDITVINVVEALEDIARQTMPESFAHRRAWRALSEWETSQPRGRRGPGTRK